MNHLKMFEDYNPDLSVLDNEITRDLQIFYEKLSKLGFVERLQIGDNLITFSVTYPNRIKSGEYKGEPDTLDFVIESDEEGGYLLSNVTRFAEPTAFQEIPITIEDDVFDKLTYLVEGV